MNKGHALKTLLVLAGIALGVALLVVMIRDQGGVAQVIREIARFGFWPFVGFVAISLLNFCLFSWRWTMILRRQLPKGSARPSFWRMYWHRMTGYAVGYMTPLNQAGGEPARVALLMADGVPSRSAVASATLDVAFELCSFVVFVALGVLFALFEHQGGVGTLVAMGGGLFVAFFVLVAFFTALARGVPMAKPLFRALRLDRVKRLQGVEHWLEDTEELMRQFFAGGMATVSGIAVLSMTMVAFRVIETFYIAWGFGVSLNFAQAFLISSLPGLALLLPVPGGLGIFEGGFAAVFAALAVPMDPLAFAFIIRLRDAVFMILGIGHMIRTGTSWVLRKATRQTH